MSAKSRMSMLCWLGILFSRNEKEVRSSCQPKRMHTKDVHDRINTLSCKAKEAGRKKEDRKERKKKSTPHHSLLRNAKSRA